MKAERQTPWNTGWTRLARRVLAAAVGAAVVSRGAAAPTPLAEAFDELAALTRAAPWGAVEWARASYLAIQLARHGPAGVPYLRGRFVRAAQSEEAFLAGAYVAVYGGEPDHRAMRAALETDPRKRVWLRALVGDWAAIRRALEGGRQWQPAVRLLPALAGPRAFCRLCMQSDDALVRRAGLYWGLWLADAAYWRQAQALSQTDPDPLTRRFAQYALTCRPAAK